MDDRSNRVSLPTSTEHLLLALARVHGHDAELLEHELRRLVAVTAVCHFLRSAWFTQRHRRRPLS